MRKNKLSDAGKIEALEELVAFFKDDLEKNNQEIESLRQRIEKLEAEKHGNEKSNLPRTE